MTVKRHNLASILSGRDKQAAARLLYNVLLLRRRLAGVSMAFLARKFGVDNSALTGNYNEIARRIAKEHGDHGFTAIPFARMQRDQSIYMPTIDKLEIDASAALANKRAEMLIRATFMEGTKDIVIFRAKAKAQKRKPGRPKGSHNKDRDLAPETGWPMPDGTRFGG